MAANLDQIVAATRQRLLKYHDAANLRAWENQAADHKPRGFRRALATASANGVAIIAELKKASPSKGLIRADFDPALLALELEHAGATALSVLTEPEFFQGSLENLRLASKNTQVPCLRKDFIVHESQILEARAGGADAILLIVAALDQAQLEFLAGQARAHDLDVLCEAHDETELHRALDAGCDLVGVNSRDLRTFKVDLETSYRLIDKIPPHVLAVAESGIRSSTDIASLRSAGYRAFLVGETLMKEAAPGLVLQSLLSAPVESAPESFTLRSGKA